MDGFFPECRATPSRPGRGRRGCRSSACPTSPTRRSRSTWRTSCRGRRRRWRAASGPAARRGKGGAEAASLPTAVLFNGGVFKADPLRNRLVAVLNAWAKSVKADTVRALAGPDLDLAVARGGGVLRAGPPRQGRPHPRRHGPGVLRRRRDGAAGGAGAAAAVEGAVRGPVRHGGGDRGGHPAAGVRAGGRRGGGVPVPRLDGPPRRRGPARWSRSGRARSTNCPRCATTLEGKANRGRVVPVHLHSKVTEVGPAGAVVLQPRRQAAVEAGVQRARGAMMVHQRHTHNG